MSSPADLIACRAAVPPSEPASAPRGRPVAEEHHRVGARSPTGEGPMPADLPDRVRTDLVARIGRRCLGFRAPRLGGDDSLQTTHPETTASIFFPRRSDVSLSSCGPAVSLNRTGRSGPFCGDLGSEGWDGPEISARSFRASPAASSASAAVSVAVVVAGSRPVAETCGVRWSGGGHETVRQGRGGAGSRSAVQGRGRAGLRGCGAGERSSSAGVRPAAPCRNAGGRGTVERPWDPTRPSA